MYSVMSSNDANQPMRPATILKRAKARVRERAAEAVVITVMLVVVAAKYLARRGIMEFVASRQHDARHDSLSAAQVVASDQQMIGCGATASRSIEFAAHSRTYRGSRAIRPG